jgi:hypothetical protein
MVMRVVVEHPDGRRYSVTPEAHKALYPDFAVVHETTDADFVAIGIPPVKKPRPKPKPKRSA